MHPAESPRSIAEVDLAALTRSRSFYPSPEAWEDQIFYFLLVDRFSDGNEAEYTDNDGKPTKNGTTPAFAPEDDGNAVRTEADAKQWREAGSSWVGGNLKGLTSKLGYLKRLGITAVWISPLLKQCVYADNTYHGYGTQNFLDIDPHFGTREDVRTLCEEAHRLGIYVVLDVIVNHAGNVFSYDADRNEETAPNGTKYFDARWDGGTYPVKGFHDAQGKPTLAFGRVDDHVQEVAWPEGAVWPRELQAPEAWTRKGHMNNWDNYPEFLEGDFFDLKNVSLGDYDGDTYRPSPALQTLCEVYKYWIAYADLDGFRVDTLKNMGYGAAQHFAHEIKEYAAKLGKTDFYLLGEIPVGAPDAPDLLLKTGMDAAEAIGEIPIKLRDMLAGHGPAQAFFDVYAAGPQEEGRSGPFWAGRRVVNQYDDHDQVGRPVKARLASEWKEQRDKEVAAITAIGALLTLSGVPCLYYGSEQALDGKAIDEHGGNQYIRESLFGGGFGARHSRNRHFFEEQGRVYREAAQIARVRQDKPALRRGAQFLRETSEDGNTFGFPMPPKDTPYRGLIAWSRILDTQEVLIVLNTDHDAPRTAWIIVDAERNPPGNRALRCLYSTNGAQIGTETGPAESRNGAAVCITVPPGGFVVYE